MMGAYCLPRQPVSYLGSSEYWKEYLKAEMKSDPWLCLHILPTFITSAMSVQGEKRQTHSLDWFYFLHPWTWQHQDPVRTSVQYVM